MFKTITEETETGITKFMSDLDPCEIGVIVDEIYEGHIVMRTASSHAFEIMDLTAPGEDSCWTGASCIKVRLLPPETIVKLEVV